MQQRALHFSPRRFEKQCIRAATERTLSAVCLGCSRSLSQYFITGFQQEPLTTSYMPALQEQSLSRTKCTKGRLRLSLYLPA